MGNRPLSSDPYPPFIEFMQYKEENGEGDEEHEVWEWDKCCVEDKLDLWNCKKHTYPDKHYNDSDDEELIGEQPSAHR
jgi:hypothetical protein